MKLLLVDGHYYVYRSYFAILNLSNSRGEPTNAIFGFTKTLRLMMKHLQPDLGAVFWDEGLPQRRVELQPAYKETRKEMPPPMVPQLDYIQNELTALLGFKNISLPEHGSGRFDGLLRDWPRGNAASKWCWRRTTRIFISSSSPTTKIYTTAKADLVSPKDAFALLGEAEVTTKWEVPPAAIGDVLALTGDSVDNIPGVGIGRKTAAALMREYRFARQTAGKPRWSEESESARKTDECARANPAESQDGRARLPYANCRFRSMNLRITPQYPALIAALEKYEFKSLLQDVRDEAARSETAVQGSSVGLR